MRGCLTLNIIPLVPTSCMPGIILLLRLCVFHHVPFVFVLLMWLSRLRGWIVTQLLACFECVYCSYFGLSCLLIFLLRSHSFFLIPFESCTWAELISWQGSDWQGSHKQCKGGFALSNLTEPCPSGVWTETDGKVTTNPSPKKPDGSRC